MKNMICDSGLLSTEASVEELFVHPLLKELGFSDKELKFKESIDSITIANGRKYSNYKPDYVAVIEKIPVLVIDAKSVTEKVEKWEKQGASYCLELNKNYEFDPVQYYCISNGLKTVVYKWNSNRPIIECDFGDFVKGNSKFKTFKEIIGRVNLSKGLKETRQKIDDSRFLFNTISSAEASEMFQKLHKKIWIDEQKSPSAAFSELIKLIFVKLYKDKELHERFGDVFNPTYSDVVFSKYWIKNQTETQDPVNDLLFARFTKELEAEIEKHKKKRIFNVNEKINLNPATIEMVVEELEHIDLYAMDEDIHGRLFESFLDATVRGKDIGQFFTPRDIVNLMVELADIKVTKESNDSVLDACCGSGGFLIASLNDMLKKMDTLAGLSNKDKETLRNRICEESIYGIDSGSDPAMYRIARMNMYLHGDGGSRIYHADSLDKEFGFVGTHDIEEDSQFEELRENVGETKKFDVILSNPPFSVKYKTSEIRHKSVIKSYALSIQNGKEVKTLLSSVMFLERYADLVSDEGTVLAIIDESILSGSEYVYVRKYIRDIFYIIGIISLPGDAFRRASARVKTSVLILRKKKKGEKQTEIFMETACYLGLEKDIAKRIGINVNELDELKREEHKRIVRNYKKYKSGIRGKYVTSVSEDDDRLDVKYCNGNRGRQEKKWKNDGYKVKTLGKLLHLPTDRCIQVDDDIYQLLKVTYEGDVIEGDIIDDSSSYKTLQQVKTWDILISNMGVGRGAIGIVPMYHNNKYVSSEYTILRANTKEEALLYTMFLRSKEIQSDILSFSTGMNRGRIKWSGIATIKAPVVSDINELRKLVTSREKLWKSVLSENRAFDMFSQRLNDELYLNGPDTTVRWLGFKPPE